MRLAPNFPLRFNFKRMTLLFTVCRKLHHVSDSPKVTTATVGAKRVIFTTQQMTIVSIKLLTRKGMKMWHY